MSGIAGIYHLNGQPVDHAELEGMVESLAHRGRDDEGVWSNQSVGLGHRMLWTTPESLHEKLPFMSRSGDLVLTADARIDNRDELMADLEISNRARGEVTDSELILCAYEEWGDRCPEKLLGDFAFAIWDRRRQSLFCARDHMGIKPFYYYRSPRVFAFASEIKALLSLPWVPRRLNETRVADYLMRMYEDKAITFYQEILRLPPAHCITVEPEVAELRQYWSLDPSRDLRLGSDDEYPRAFRELFTEAVRCRIRSAFPVGSMLSGGLDSSSIVCVARELLAGNGESRLQTFSAIFDDMPSCDERPFINIVLAQGGIEPHYLRGDRLSPLADIERVLSQQDEAFSSSLLYLFRGLYSMAEQQGARVLMDGFDGDTTAYSGNKYLTELARTGRWRTLANELRSTSGRFRSSWWSLLWLHCIKTLAPDPLRPVWRVLRGRHRLGLEVSPVINHDFAQRVDLMDRLEEFQRKPIVLRTTRDAHYRSLSSGMFPSYLEANDKSAAVFSLESRYPFFDKRLVEFCLALPSEQKFAQGWPRRIHRRGMANVLPKEIAWRPGKISFSASFRWGLLNADRGLLDKVILSDPGILAKYVNISALRETYQRYVAAQGTSADGHTAWRAVMLGLWLGQTGMTP